MKIKVMKHLRLELFWVTLLCTWITIGAAEWQWSVIVKGKRSSETNDYPTAFLWIPPGCKQVRAVVFGNHNMTEEGIMEHSEFRRTLSKLSFAEVWVTPGLSQDWDVKTGIQHIFEQMMVDLSNVSGYTELKYVPVVPIGHSAMATFPWNFAAWNPERTLAILSIHGDAPQTNLTGYGRANLNWEEHTIDGIPGLMVVGEYEWWEDRVQPALDYRKAHPLSPVSFLCDAGRGHFDYSDGLIRYLCLFLEKSARYRLPAKMPMNAPATLIPVNPEKGYLADRWRPDRNSRIAPAPYSLYKGNANDAFWYFDREIAHATEKYYVAMQDKKEQFIGFIQKDNLCAQPHFLPDADGVTFHLKAVYTDERRKYMTDSHAKISPAISRICGPVKIVNDTTFTVCFYRMGLNNTKRTGDIWLLGMSDGDKCYKSAVQQVNIRIPYPNAGGQSQRITFAPVENVGKETKHIRLHAVSSSGLPVYYYVKEGPAELSEDGVLTFTPIPPRAKYPLKVTVVAWQYGRSIEPKIQTAEPVERSFYIIEN